MRFSYNKTPAAWITQSLYYSKKIMSFSVMLGKVQFTIT